MLMLRVLLTITTLVYSTALTITDTLFIKVMNLTLPLKRLYLTLLVTKFSVVKQFLKKVGQVFTVVNKKISLQAKQAIKSILNHLDVLN